MITSIISKLPFINKQETIDFYLKLGFRLESDYTDYLIIKNKNTELHFFSFPTLLPAQSDFMIYLRVTDIETLYETVQQKGISIHPTGRLEDKLWRQREFAILDPNGTLLTFGQPI